MIQNLQPRISGTKLLITGGSNRPPLERTPMIEYLFKKAKKLADKYFELKLTEQAVGSFSDGNITGPIAPTLDGLGAVGDGAHARYEHIIINEMPRRSALLAILLLSYDK